MSPVRVLILAANPPAGWLVALQDAGFVCETSLHAIPEPGPEIVIRDRHAFTPDGALPAHDHAVAQIAIDDEDSRADLTLPADASGQELVRVCGLLAQLVQLRKRLGQVEASQEVLSQRASTDALTRLGNRHVWDEQLQVWKQAGHPGGVVAVLDIDHFKRINDGWGHDAGDALLRRLGDSLRSEVRGRDLVVRLGGDEFGVLLEGLRGPQAPLVVERIRALGEQLAEGPPVTLSAGYAIVDPVGAARGTDPAEAYRLAAGALRSAKAQGRNQTVPKPDGAGGPPLQ